MMGSDVIVFLEATAPIPAAHLLALPPSRRLVFWWLYGQHAPATCADAVAGTGQHQKTVEQSLADLTRAGLVQRWRRERENDEVRGGARPWLYVAEEVE